VLIIGISTGVNDSWSTRNQCYERKIGEKKARVKRAIRLESEEGHPQVRHVQALVLSRFTLLDRGSTVNNGCGVDEGPLGTRMHCLSP
jgi:hypothetical protein